MVAAKMCRGWRAGLLSSSSVCWGQVRQCRVASKLSRQQSALAGDCSRESREECSEGFGQMRVGGLVGGRSTAGGAYMQMFRNCWLLRGRCCGVCTGEGWLCSREQRQDVSVVSAGECSGRGCAVWQQRWMTWAGLLCLLVSAAACDSTAAAAVLRCVVWSLSALLWGLAQGGICHQGAARTTVVRHLVCRGFSAVVEDDSTGLAVRLS